MSKLFYCLWYLYFVPGQKMSMNSHEIANQNKHVDSGIPLGESPALHLDSAILVPVSRGDTAEIFGNGAKYAKSNMLIV